MNDIIKLYFSFNGEIGRLKYSIGIFSIWILIFLTFFGIFPYIFPGNDEVRKTLMPVLLGLGIFLLIWILSALIIKRLRDIGYSRYMLIIVLLFSPFIGLLMLKKGKNANILTERQL